MTVHISARVAWHDDGWNGHICGNPAANTFCVGNYSYPGDLIAKKRSLEWEIPLAGRPCNGLDGIPPCSYSINAFGLDEMSSAADPPEWFDKSTSTKQWTLPAATVSIWPYEEMYVDDVKRDGRFDNDRRRERASSYFAAIEKDKSLIFYYANYSNPFSEEESKRYSLIGVSRVKTVGEELFYDGTSEHDRQRYAGGFVWQRNITSHYPDQGLRIPYHRYRDQPEILDRIALFPENPRLFKYATRQMSDDDALGLVESFLRVVHILQEIGDTTEDWQQRASWLEGMVSELWSSRGLLPGMGPVLESLNFTVAIPFLKEQVLAGKEKDAHASIFSFLEGQVSEISGLDVSEQQARGSMRQWKLRSSEEQALLKDVLPRFDLNADQITKIINEKQAENGITADLPSIARNPYILSEQYLGDNLDDFIPWGAIDRGTIPSPELGGERLAELDDPRRLRGLLVDVLKGEGDHCFMAADRALEVVNHRLDVLPEWKRFNFHTRYIDADEDILSEALHIRREAGVAYLYLRHTYEDERKIEESLNFLKGGPNIKLQSPVTDSTWMSYLYDSKCILAEKADEKYREVISKQVKACQSVFIRPLGVLLGEAGTGKTTAIKAIVKAIKRGHGVGTSVIALSPTGKATDRIREILESDDSLKGQVEVSTLHSFLARHGWLNPNMSFKRSGGSVESGYTTYILDESSMLDLALTAAFFRAVQWNSVQRLIFVGDPNQLPPIGRGRVFADIIEHLQSEAPESVAFLEENLRQTQGLLTGGGTGIIDLAQCYLNTGLPDQKDENLSTAAEIMLKKVQEGGDIDRDLRVIYWKGQEELNDLLVKQIEQDMETDLADSSNGDAGDGTDKPWELWGKAFDGQPDYLQIVTPYRGEFFGTEELNRICQKHVRGELIDRVGMLGGITFFDKVIQVINRPRSRPIAAYNHTTRGVDQVEVFNGQIGFTSPHPFDNNAWRSSNFRISRFSVSFSRREGLSVGYGRGLGSGCPAEAPEENLELAYAISVHKAQGSDFERVYLIVPKNKTALLSTELFYTALTRARKHCTLLVEQDVSVLVEMRRRDSSKLMRINSSLFAFKPVPDELMEVRHWHDKGRILGTLAEIRVRSKSEFIIVNMLEERGIKFLYEEPLYADDGTLYLPDFTINWRGSDYYWEHLGLLDRDDYRAHWEQKRAWYERFFPGQLILTEESVDLSHDADEIIQRYFT